MIWCNYILSKLVLNPRILTRTCTSHIKIFIPVLDRSILPQHSKKSWFSHQKLACVAPLSVVFHYLDFPNWFWLSTIGTTLIQVWRIELKNRMGYPNLSLVIKHRCWNPIEIYLKFQSRPPFASCGFSDDVLSAQRPSARRPRYSTLQNRYLLKLFLKIYIPTDFIRPILIHATRD